MEGGVCRRHSSEACVAEIMKAPERGLLLVGTKREIAFRKPVEATISREHQIEWRTIWSRRPFDCI